MTNPKTLLLAAFALSFAACGPDAAQPSQETDAEAATDAPLLPPSEPETPASLRTDTDRPEAVVVLAPGELRAFVGANASARPLPFGSERSFVSTVLLNIEGGNPETATLADCGGVASERWPSGLTTYYRSGEFVGWFAGQGAELSTATGVGVGSTYDTFAADFAAAYVEETTLGWEAATEDLAALFDGPGGDARITALWSGETCIAR